MGSFAIATHNHKILMLLRDPDDSWGNHWCWVGGGTEPGETPEETLIREAKEEANLDLTDFAFLFKWESHSRPGTHHYVYHVPLNDQHLKAMKLGDEGQRLEFFSLDQAEDLPLTPGFKEAIQKHRHLIEETTEDV